MQNLNDLFKSIFSGIQSSIKRINSKIKKLDTDIKNIDIPTSLPNPNALTFTGAVNKSYDGSSPKTVNVPTKLPNPKALTLTGAVSASYDGSSGVSVWIPDASGKMDRYNPTGTGSFSLNRKAGTVVGANSHAEGSGATASGWYSHAEGRDTTASNDCSHAEGDYTTASGKYSHAEGSITTASGNNSHAEGSMTSASGGYSHAEGQDTSASGERSHAEGQGTSASGTGSHTEGYHTKASSSYQHVQGKYNIEDPSDVYADIVGNGTKSKPSNAATVDWSGNAWYAGDVYIGSTSGTNKDAGSKKLATEDSISGKMDKNNPTGTGSFSLNRKSGSTIGTGSHTEGYSATASGDYSHAEGYSATASGNYSHVEGFLSKALGEGSHAEGHDTEASGDYSHAEGYGAIASGEYAHAEGFAAKALGKYSHAEGDTTRASGNDSHAEGTGTTASGESSHAEGAWTTVSGEGAHAEGSWTKASSSNQHVQGKYNIEDSSNVYADIIGNGTLSSKSNASTVDWHGNAWYAGDVYVGSTSGTNKDSGSKKLATEEYVDNSVSIIEIPTALADLTTDSTHRLVTDTEKSTWNAKAEASAIPTKVSQLTNDSGFATTSDVTTGISIHNSSTEAHNDIRLLVQELTNKLNTLADSDDTTLDQLSEIVAYIKNNKSLIDSITTSKVNVTDIIDNLTTSVTNKPLSAKQGVALKALIDAIVVPTKLPNPNALTFTGAVTGSYDGSVPLTVEIPRGDSIVPAPSSADNGKYLGCENGAAKWLPVEASGGGDISLGLTAASVGQTIKVKAVDENGKPTEWEAAKEKTLKWIKVHSSTLTEEATSFSVSADENGKPITDYNPLGIAIALYIPADSTQSDNNGQLWAYPQSKMGDNSIIRVISTISGWKTIDRDAVWMWQGGDILGLNGNNNGATPVYRASDYVMDGVYLLVYGNGNHLPVGTKAVVTILCEV